MRAGDFISMLAGDFISHKLNCRNLSGRHEMLKKIDPSLLT